jgi:RNA polymerase sigma-70 factor, ECF subfamily
MPTILINATKSGNDVSFESLWEENHVRLYQHCYHLLGAREDAEDACQETFLKAWRTWEARKHDSNLSAWLYTIATNTSYDVLRHKRLIAFQTLDEWDYLSALDVETEVEVRTLLEQALKEQPAYHRRILLDVGSNSYSRQEMAARAGITLGNFNDHLYRARKAFRQHYQEQEVA